MHLHTHTRHWILIWNITLPLRQTITLWENQQFERYFKGGKKERSFFSQPEKLMTQGLST